MCKTSDSVLKLMVIQEPQCTPGALKMKKYLHLYFCLYLYLYLCLYSYPHIKIFKLSPLPLKDIYNTFDTNIFRDIEFSIKILYFQNYFKLL